MAEQAETLKEFQNTEFRFFSSKNFALKTIALDKIKSYIRSLRLKCEKGYENVYFLSFL